MHNIKTQLKTLIQSVVYLLYASGPHGQRQAYPCLSQIRPSAEVSALVYRLLLVTTLSGKVGKVR